MLESIKPDRLELATPSIQSNKGSRVHCTRDIFHVAHSGTLAALCSRDTRYSIVGEPDGSW